MQQGLIAGVPRTKLLQELMCVAQDLHHFSIALDGERGEGAGTHPAGGRGQV